MSTVFMFGAGASHGSVDCAPGCPPLGFDLFDELQKAGGLAASIKGELAESFRLDFETGMDEFSTQREVDLDELLRDMGKYFAQFTPGPKNLYRRLITDLGKDRERVVFSTINYDLLIELAANGLDLPVSYIINEPRSGPALRVLKMHGSSNFLPPVSMEMFKGVKIVGSKTAASGCRPSLFECPLIPATQAQTIEFCEKRDSLAPAMAIYAPSKWVPFGGKFIGQQRDWWQAEVRQAEYIFVIGASVHERDAHIGNPLTESNGCLVYVDPNPETFCKWAVSHRKKPFDVIDKTFEDAIPLIMQRIGRH